VTWHVTDWSTGSTNVTLTIKDNTALNASGGFADATGMTANNPTKEELDVVYDGVLVPAIVKDDYLYRAPCPAGSEMLFRFGNIAPGKYNVTVFMAEPATAMDNLARFGLMMLMGPMSLQPKHRRLWLERPDQQRPDSDRTARTVTVDIKANQSLWFGYMEDSTGGISGMIIRGIASQSTERPTLSMAKAADGSLTLTYTGKLYSSDTANGTFAIVSNAAARTRLPPEMTGRTPPSTSPARRFAGETFLK